MIGTQCELAATFPFAMVSAERELKLKRCQICDRAVPTVQAHAVTCVVRNMT